MSRADVTLEQEVASLRRQVRELSEELEEYRHSSVKVDRARIRANWVRERLGGDCWLVGYRAICIFIDHPGQIVTKARMVAGVAASDPEERDGNLAAVAVSWARKALKPHGIEIKTFWGDGWVMSRGEVERLRALLGDEPDLRELQGRCI